jgi:hypothetical protein
MENKKTEEILEEFLKKELKFARNEEEARKKALDCLRSDADYEMADVIDVE